MRREETLPGLVGEQGAGSPALVFGGDTITAAELDERAARVAGGLAAAASAPATALRCGCPTGRSGWSCTSR